MGGRSYTGRSCEDRISRKLSALLRHGNKIGKRAVDSRGWVEVAQVMPHLGLDGRAAGIELVRETVRAAESGHGLGPRFEMSVWRGTEWIRARYGHSLPQVLDNGGASASDVPPSYVPPSYNYDDAVAIAALSDRVVCLEDLGRASEACSPLTHFNSHSTLKMIVKFRFNTIFLFIFQFNFGDLGFKCLVVQPCLPLHPRAEEEIANLNAENLCFHVRMKVMAETLKNIQETQESHDAQCGKSIDFHAKIDVFSKQKLQYT